MLVAAYPHAGAIQALYTEAYNSPKFQWFFGAYNDMTMTIPSSDWAALHFASVDANGDVQGHLFAEVDRDARTVEHVGAICFDPGHSVTFAKDLRRFFARLLCGGWERVSWRVVTGNPIEPMYDKAITRIGGRIVGTQRKYRRNRVNGGYVDSKMYEVLPEEVPEPVMTYLKSIDPLRAWSAK